MSANLEATARSWPREAARPGWSPAVARLVVLAAAGAGIAAAALAAGDTGRAVAAAGDDLTRLLRGMAALKALAAAGLLAAMLWRLGVAVSGARLALYALSGAAAMAGPVLIWGMAHVVSGSAATHAGLLAGIVLLWRDPAMGARLAALLAARRARAG